MSGASKQSADQLSLVTAVDRALSILDAFNARQPELALSELAEAVNLPKSTTYRLASTLEHHRYLRREPNSSRYHLGLRAAALGNLALGQLGLGDHMRDYMRSLAEMSGETVNLAILDRAEIVYVQRIRSTAPLAIDVPVGVRSPVHASALGKVLLTCLPVDELESVLATISLPALTLRTITDPAELRLQVETIREQGFAIDDGEFSEGMSCVAAPLFDHTGNVMASLAIAGPSVRMQGPKLTKAREQLLDTASQISAVLGYADRRSSTANSRPQEPSEPIGPQSRSHVRRLDGVILQLTI